jgi:hypothetical protein
MFSLTCMGLVNAAAVTWDVSIYDQEVYTSNLFVEVLPREKDMSITILRTKT